MNDMMVCVCVCVCLSRHLSLLPRPTPCFDSLFAYNDNALAAIGKMLIDGTSDMFITYDARGDDVLLLEAHGFLSHFFWVKAPWLLPIAVSHAAGAPTLSFIANPQCGTLAFREAFGIEMDAFAANAERAAGMWV